MILSFDGRKLTPKQKAAELIESQVAMLLKGYWVEQERIYDYETGRETALTDREIAKIEEQLEKYAQRIYKILGLTY